MADTDWWETLKEGDVLLWTQNKWRYKGRVTKVDTMSHSVLIDVIHRFTQFDEKHRGSEQEFQTMDRIVSFPKDALLDPDMEWMHKKAADIHITVRETVKGRDFRIWGEGDGLSHVDGTGGGLRYMGVEEPLSS